MRALQLSACRWVAVAAVSVAIAVVWLTPRAEHPVRPSATAVAPSPAFNADGWFRLQRSYPTDRRPPHEALQEAVDSLPAPPSRRIGPTRRSMLALPNEQWVSIGPAPIFTQTRNYSGRVTALAPHPTVATTIFIGTDNGGIWRTMDGGVTWTSLTDGIPVPGIQSLAIDPVDPLLLYATTIQRTYGTRWLRSTDGGQSWSVSAITTDDGETLSPRLCAVNDFKACIPPSSGRVVVDPRFAGSASTSRLYYAGLSHLMRSDDSGGTFRPVLSLDVDLDFGDPREPDENPEAEYIRDVAIDAARPDRLFVAVVRPDCADASCARTSGIVAVYRSLDAGATWTRSEIAALTEFAPSAGTRYADPGAIYVPRLRVAVAPSDPDTVAVAIRDEVEDRVRLIKSVDGGQSWTGLPGPASSVTWPLALAFSPTDADTVYVGSAGNYRSTDGGQTWTTLDATHVDNIAMAFDAAGTLLVGNDGGVWRSTGGTGMTPIHARLPITEFYSIAAHPTNPLLIAGGTQDNGNIVFQGSLGWSLYTGGDGGDTVWDPTPNAVVVYAEIEWFVFEGRQVFQFFRCQTGGCLQRMNGLDLNDDGPFIPRIIMDPTNSSTLYLTVERLWRTQDRADNWAPASPSVADLERCWDDPDEGPMCAKAAYFTAAGVAATAPHIIYGGTLNGDVRVTADHGASWRSIAGEEAGPLPVRPVNDLLVDPLDAGSVYVSYSGFNSGGSGSGHVFHTADGGDSWTDISGNLPDVPVNTLLLDPDSVGAGGARVLYAGTDVGVYRATVNGGATVWAAFGAGLPPVIVNRLAYSPANRTLLAATYGRGLYAISERFGR
jgi:photosystem II stability/assembly factor-like uncharacterized protein